MAYTEKFQALAKQARSQADGVDPQDVDALIAAGSIALDVRDKEEHDSGHIDGSINVSRGALEMNIEHQIPDLDATVLCYCNAVNRGALSAATLKSMGHRNAMFIDGELNGYSALGRPVRFRRHCRGPWQLGCAWRDPLSRGQFGLPGGGWIRSNSADRVALVTADCDSRAMAHR